MATKDKPGRYRAFIDAIWQAPAFHNAIYEREAGYTFDDWHNYRNPTFRHRPEPILSLRVAAGYWQQLLMVVCISIFTCCYFVYLVPLGAPGSFQDKIGSQLFAMATLFVSLLTVFKLNTSYARWWEARTQWGTSLAALRNYMRMLMGWIRPDTRHVAEAAARWIPAAFLLLKEHLRDGGDGIAAVKTLLLPHELKYLETHGNKPLAAAHALSQLAIEANIEPILQAQLQEQISIYILMAAGSERILRTPIPTGYTRFTSRACIMYIIVIPVLIWPAVGWATPIISFVITFMLLGIENVGVQIEEPFRVLHLEALCTAIELAARDLMVWDGPAMSAGLAFKRQQPAPSRAPSDLETEGSTRCSDEPDMSAGITEDAAAAGPTSAHEVRVEVPTGRGYMTHVLSHRFSGAGSKAWEESGLPAL